MVRLKQFLILVAMMALVISGCESPEPAPTVSPLTMTSPMELASQSPLPTVSSLPEGPRFTIDLPAKAGETVVRGTGGPDVPLAVVNITQMAFELGQGKVGPDGTFEIYLGQSLVAGERVGLMLGDLAGTGFDMSDFQRGPGYVDMPFIGVVFTSTLVVE
jgi:hypothetical protein